MQVLNKIIKFIDNNTKLSIFFILSIPFQILILNNYEVISYQDIFVCLKLLIILTVLFNIFNLINFVKKFRFENLISLLIIINILLNFAIFNNGFITFEIFIIIQVIFIFIYFYFFSKLKKIFNKIYKFVTITSALLILMIFFKFFNYDGKDYKNFFKNDYFTNLKLENKIDTYVIVPDGLMSFEKLKQNKFYNDNKYEQILRENDLTPLKSFSNYPTTFASIPSLLNGSLFKEDSRVEEKIFFKTIGRSSSVKMFLKNNYEVLWFENNWSGSKCNNNQFTCLQKKRVFNFVNNEIVLEYFKLININLYWSDKIYYLLNIKRKYHLDNITAMLKDYKYTKPVFVFAHIMIPHMPFLVDANCNPIYLNKSYTPTWSERKYFLQVECLKKQIIDFNNFIKSKNRPYLLIIASDTGWTFDDKIHPSLNPKALWPKSHFQNNIIISKKYVCFDKDKTVSNVEVLTMALYCSENKPHPIIDNYQFDAYYSKTGHVNINKFVKRSFSK